MATILIVEDNPYHRRLMTRLLERNGHHVEIASDGEEALQKAKDTQPDLITLDMGLPDLDGQTVINLLRDEAKDKPPLIVAVTAWPPEVASRMAAAYGCDYYISKPIKAQEFAQTIERVLQQKTSPSEN